MLTGNADQDDNLQVRDINGSDHNRWAPSNGMLNEYLSADVNLDGRVDGTDRILIQNNIGLFSQIPFKQ